MAIAGHLYVVARARVTPQNVAVKSKEEVDLERFLQIVAKFPAKTVFAFLQHRRAVAELDGTLLISLTRLALLACWKLRRENYQRDEDDEYVKSLKSGLEAAISKEQSWQVGGKEPEWPEPPKQWFQGLKRTLTIYDNPEGPDYYFDYQVGAEWLKIFGEPGIISNSVSQAVLRACRDWLLATNSPGEDGKDDHMNWTRGLMKFAATHARQWSNEVRKALIYDVLSDFSDEAFIDAAATIILQSDSDFLKDDATDRSYLLSIRYELWPRLQKTKHWDRHCHLRPINDTSIEVALSKIVSAYFMRASVGNNEYQIDLRGLSGHELSPFLPLLSEIVKDSQSCPIIANMLSDIQMP